MLSEWKWLPISRNRSLKCTLIFNDIHWPEMYDDEDYYYQQDYTIKLLNYIGKSLSLT